ncbi:hypothetical protein M406DRAFT_251837 [Cryphonectria parasitica EP155]|uniref:Glycoside hydrolase 131 catalytic N-terminal domain-containing protein n=1 Tax=Cryphonectria parasitica (strain ATCC 38755 / EP155) TaxID=660469 RepID=A0A9P5CRB4_CRYP1|nr:uncharacterized protein M406DRAFT_251837 [Cryphonectria parasitica EP155]KAF3766925.1 hypothetical protein M406DRAFT_251837 [Cryphonectria parasitica EP155]
MFSQSLFYLSSLLSLAAAQSIQFDGRIPTGTQLTEFDVANGIFDPSNVFGQNLTFSKLLQLPAVQPKRSLMTIPPPSSDQSIFAPSPTNIQTGFRRAELLPASNNGTDPSTTGVKTLHFSLMKNTARPLNLSHEYQLVFLESSDFSTNQVVLKTGTVLGQTVADPDTLMLFSNVNNASLLFSTNFTASVFHNFGLTLDFTKNTTQVFYSTGTTPLAQVTEALPNDVSGQGQFHFGLLKKPVNGGADITTSGEQPAGIDEGIIYGGIFEEDSSAGVISKSLEA